VNPPFGCSDDWDFPANKFPNAGWLGRVHRGTPWQTVYLKSSSIDVPTWLNWTGNTNYMLNVGQTSLYPTNVLYLDAFITHPTNDWRLMDVFTAALSDTAARGQLSINQPNLAAWSAALSGVYVLTNNAVAGTLDGLPIEPAGVYDPINTNTWSPLVQLVNNINNVRATFPNGAFHSLGDILAVPNLTIGGPSPQYVGTYPNGSWSGVLSPFLNPNAPLNDAAIERLPQQILGLLKCDHTPRFVIYAFGQTLKPESTRAIVKSGAFAGMCTNYQIVAEAATRTVVRFEGVPQFQPGSPPPAITSLHPVIESFTVLPPD
jgi:hypothetical protein